MPERVTVVEQCEWREAAEVDAGSRVVRNVALAGGTSRNGYVYSESALRAAVPLYEQKPVFLDHAADRSRPRERSTRDLVGSVENARFERGRVRGDIAVLDTESGRTFLALVSSKTPGLGMSHVVLAERSADGASVSQIHDVISVDAVVGPATTTTFREACESPETLDGLEVGDRKSMCGLTLPLPLPEREGNADLELRVESPEQDAVEQDGNALRAQLDSTLCERRLLQERVRELEALEQRRVAREAAAMLIHESGLPEYAAGDEFIAQVAAATPAARNALIRERLALVRRAEAGVPRSDERPGNKPDETAAFVKAIRGERSGAALLW